MTRNLKILALALVALFVFAVAASSASAQGKLTSDGSVTLTGATTGVEGANAWTFFGTRTECGNIVYTGHKHNTAPLALISSGESSITVTPHYSECDYFPEGAVIPETVDMNGCDFVFHLEGTTGGGDTYAVETTIVCPEGKHIQVTVFTSSSHAFKSCTVTTTENPAGYAGLHATDTTNGHVDISGTVTGITSDRSGLCGSAMETSGQLHFDLTVSGVDSSGKATGIGLSD